MGATIRKLSNEGHKVYIYWLGSGRPAQTFGDKTEQDKVKNDVLEILGAEEVIIEAPPLLDNEFDDETLLNIIQRIEPALDTIKPDKVFSHWQHCTNIDHQITAKATLTAVVRRPEIKELYAFEVLSSSEWSPKEFKPTYFVNIEDTLKDKLEAMKCYKDEMREFPSGRSIEGICTLANYRGMQCGVKAAEGFISLRTIK